MVSVTRYQLTVSKRKEHEAHSLGSRCVVRHVYAKHSPLDLRVQTEGAAGHSPRIRPARSRRRHGKSSRNSWVNQDRQNP